MTFNLSGGLKPTDQTWVYAVDEPPPSGHTRAEVSTVLEAASDPELIDAELEPMPKDQCCDRQSYRITVEWDDGSSRTYETLDGVQQPDVFEDFLSLVA